MLKMIRLERQTMLARLGWQRGMSLHNLLILPAFSLLGSCGAGWAALVADLARSAWAAGGHFPDLADERHRRGRQTALAAAAHYRRGRRLALTVYFMNLALWTG